MKILQTIFSEQATKYTMVLFTFGHLLGGGSIEDYVTRDSYLNRIVQKFRGGIISSTTRIASMSLSKMIMKNEGSYYTIKMIAEAKSGVMKTEQCCKQ